MTTRAASYVRQSVADPDGISRATKLIRELIAKEGWALAGEYADDGVSASKARGTGTAWARMLADIKAGKVDVVVGVDVDRLIRTINDLVTLIDLGVKVRTVNGEIDLASADGEFRATMLAGIARFEVRRKAERQKRAGTARAAAGRPFAGGRRAFGWAADGITPLEPEAGWVRWLHDELAAGHTYQSMTKRLNAEKVKTTMGGVWTPMQVKAILRRPRNAGILIHNGEVQKVSRIAPLVDEATHRSALTLMKTGKRNPRRDDAWLSGIIQCACGSPMTAKLLHRKGKEPVRMYQCYASLKATKQGTGPGTAGRGQHTTIPAETAETKTLGMLYGLYSGGWIDAEDKSAAADIKRLSDRLTALADETRDATLDLEIPDVDKAVVRARLARLGAERKTASTELDRLRAGSLSAAWLEKLKADGEDSAESAESFAEWFGGLSLDDKRSVARSVTVSVASGRGGSERVSVDPR